jgi:hypothetical protein
VPDGTNGPFPVTASYATNSNGCDTVTLSCTASASQLNSPAQSSPQTGVAIYVSNLIETIIAIWRINYFLLRSTTAMSPMTRSDAETASSRAPSAARTHSHAPRTASTSTDHKSSILDSMASPRTAAGHTHLQLVKSMFDITKINSGRFHDF